jgi:hypothetical protein
MLSDQGDGQHQLDPFLTDRHRFHTAQEWRPFPLERVTKLSPNTSIFRFALPSPQHEMGMPVASCITVQGVSRDGPSPAIVFLYLAPPASKAPSCRIVHHRPGRQQGRSVPPNRISSVDPSGISPPPRMNARVLNLEFPAS